MRSNKSYVKETLAFVNKHRKRAGLNPLYDLYQGRCTGSDCPISNSLYDVYPFPYTTAGDEDSPALVYYGEDLAKPRGKIQLPRAGRRFIRAFDTGRLPEYYI